MATEATVSFVAPVNVPGDCNGGKPVGSDEFSAEFKVKATYSDGGCFAVDVRLKAYHRFYPDTTIAYPRGISLKCHCFKSQEEWTFFVRCGGQAGPGKAPLKPADPNAIELDPLQGDWPTGDLPRDHLELYVQVAVYECKRGKCEKDKCEPGTIAIASLNKRTLIGSGKLEGEGDTVIHPGDSPRLYIEAAGQAASAGIGQVKSALPQLTERGRDISYEFNALEDRIYRLERASRAVGLQASNYSVDDSEK